LDGVRFGILEDYAEDVMRILAAKSVKQEIIDDAIIALEWQRLDEKRFPNVMLFIDDENNSMEFEDFFKQCIIICFERPKHVNSIRPHICIVFDASINSS